MWKWILNLFGFSKKELPVIEDLTKEERQWKDTLQTPLKDLSDTVLTDKIKQQMKYGKHRPFLTLLLREKERREQVFKDYMTYLDIIDNESLLRIISDIRSREGSSIKITFLRQLYYQRCQEQKQYKRKTSDLTALPEHYRIDNDISQATQTAMMVSYMDNNPVRDIDSLESVRKDIQVPVEGKGGTFEGGGASGNWSNSYNRNIAPSRSYIEPAPRHEPNNTNDTHTSRVAHHTPSYHAPSHSHHSHDSGHSNHSSSHSNSSSDSCSSSDSSSSSCD